MTILFSPVNDWVHEENQILHERIHEMELENTYVNVQLTAKEHLVEEKSQQINLLEIELAQLQAQFNEMSEAYEEAYWQLRVARRRIEAMERNPDTWIPRIPHSQR